MYIMGEVKTIETYRSEITVINKNHRLSMIRNLFSFTANYVKLCNLE